MAMMNLSLSFCQSLCRRLVDRYAHQKANNGIDAVKVTANSAGTSQRSLSPVTNERIFIKLKSRISETDQIQNYTRLRKRLTVLLLTVEIDCVLTTDESIFSRNVVIVIGEKQANGSG